MDKLEVGQWYRQSEEPKGYLYLYKGQDDKKETTNPPHYPYHRFDRYVDGKIDQIDMPVSKTYINKYQNKLEALYPSEALILLGNGFVLRRRERLVKLNDHGFMQFRLTCEDLWSALMINNFKGFTIHSLPDIVEFEEFDTGTMGMEV